MKLMIPCLVLIVSLCSLVAAGSLGGSEKIVKLEHTSNGFWQKKIIWKPRWMKSWQEKKVYVAHWKKVWGPVKLTEWVPLPKPPPGWIKPAHKHVHHHHKVAVPHLHHTYAPGHLDYIHREPVFHPHKSVSVVNPEGLHFHAVDSHYGPAFHHHVNDHHHHHVNDHHHHDHHSAEFLAAANHHQHHHHPHNHHAHGHEEIIHTNAEPFSPHFLPLNLDQLKVK